MGGNWGSSVLSVVFASDSGVGAGSRESEGLVALADGTASSVDIVALSAIGLGSAGTLAGGFISIAGALLGTVGAGVTGVCPSELVSVVGWFVWSSIVTPYWLVVVSYVSCVSRDFLIVNNSSLIVSFT